MQNQMICNVPFSVQSSEACRRTIDGRWPLHGRLKSRCSLRWSNSRVRSCLCSRRPCTNLSSARGSCAMKAWERKTNRRMCRTRMEWPYWQYLHLFGFTVPGATVDLQLIRKQSGGPQKSNSNCSNSYAFGKLGAFSIQCRQIREGRRDRKMCRVQAQYPASQTMQSLSI